jgi:hypothetical protein
MSRQCVEPVVDVLNKYMSHLIKIAVVVVMVVVMDCGVAVGFGCESLICCLTLHTRDASNSVTIWEVAIWKVAISVCDCDCTY